MKYVSILSFTVLALAALTPGCHRRKATEAQPEPPPTEVWLAPEQVSAAKLVIESVSRSRWAVWCWPAAA